jgi:hypothetical protein
MTIKTGLLTAVGALAVIGALAGILLFTNSLQSRNPPADFNLVFKYGVGAKNELDTFSQTYTKDMVMDPPITIKLKLTGQELADIYRKINSLKLFDKKEEPVGENVFVTPCRSYYLKTQVGSVQKDLSWDDCHGKISDNLQRFANYVIPIIESKEEYKGLPTPKGLYL